MRTIVIVEGHSDKAALEAFARLRGCDLEAEGVSVVPIGGAHAMPRFMRSLDPADAPGVRLTVQLDQSVDHVDTLQAGGPEHAHQALLGACAPPGGVAAPNSCGSSPPAGCPAPPAAQPGVRSSWGRGFAEYARHNVDATERLLEAAVSQKVATC